MADVNNVVEQAEDVTGLLKKTAAEYESAAAAMSRLTEEAKRELARLEELAGRDDLRMDWAVDLFMEANELKLAMMECGDELEDACDELLGIKGEIDLADITTYPTELQTEYVLMSEDEQEEFRAMLADVSEEAEEANAKGTRPKRRRKRMSV